MARELLEVEKAYAAGFFDGEGHIGVHVHSTLPSVRIIIAQNDLPPLYWLEKRFGGRVRDNCKENGSNIWVASKGPEVIYFIECILPYCLRRKTKLLIGLEIARLTQPHSGKPTPTDVIYKRFKLMELFQGAGNE